MTAAVRGRPQSDGNRPRLCSPSRRLLRLMARSAPATHIYYAAARDRKCPNGEALRMVRAPMLGRRNAGSEAFSPIVGQPMVRSPPSDEPTLMVTTSRRIDAYVMTSEHTRRGTFAHVDGNRADFCNNNDNSKARLDKRVAVYPNFSKRFLLSSCQ